MKFGFVTCVQLGKSCMEAIYQVGGSLDLIITLEDTQAVNKSGRVYLDDFCILKNVPLLKSSHINNDNCIKLIKKYKIDWLFIIGWSQIANKKLLSAPQRGVLGIHPTLLPQGRGRASIPWAILKNLSQTGVSLFKLDEGVDTGEIIEQLVIPLSEQITATELYGIVNNAHIILIENIFPLLENDTITLKMQDDSKATEWQGRIPSDGEIDLKGSVFDAERLIRAVTKPYPGAFVILDELKYIVWKCKILDKGCSSSYKTIKFKDGLLSLIKYDVLS